MVPNYTQLTHSLKTNGYVLTRQREFVVDYLCRYDDIPKAEDVWMALRTQVSWATVFKSIRILQSLGWLEQVENTGGRSNKLRWARYA